MRKSLIPATIIGGFIGILTGLSLAILVGCAMLDRVTENIPTPDPVTVVSNVVVNVTTTNTSPSDTTVQLPFDRSKCQFKRLDPTTLEWAETRKLTVTKISKDKIWSQCSGPDWPRRGDGLQGTFNLAVEQPDLAIVVGSWDYNRAKHQPMKGLENLYGAEHSFFGIRQGCRFWVFTSASNRDRQRTVLERSSIEGPFIWNWEAP